MFVRQTQGMVDQLERGIAPLNDYVFSLRDAFQMFVVHQVIAVACVSNDVVIRVCVTAG